ncbi:hypothetical protein BDZ94DRAFT_1264961 [Collybia nuda]|uniref:Uncharacterized protein n=1 Tax=Collybia nuda TaxID=64659 RepID=A0A9P5Y238_9AGAR|nr:hypothetical protein BDZ94DRAFT_1264961 [Collybia nuda]
MVSEESPLLATLPADNRAFDHATIYDRFSARQKVTILAVVSGCGLMPLFISGSFVPLIPQIANELDSTGPIVR